MSETLAAGARPPGTAPPPALPLAAGVRAALSALEQQAVSCCYWKSTRKLPAALAGEGDIDLLIARRDEARAQALLLSQGFKVFPAAGDREPPAVLTYLGHDEESGRLLHLHVHFRLVVGPPFAKDWHLPWEDTVLARAVPHARLPVRHLDPACEALLLLTRGCLELGGWDPVSWRHAAARKDAFNGALRQLASEVDDRDLYRLAAELLSDEAAELAVAALHAGGLPHRHSRFARAVRRHLAIGGRSYNRPEARLRAFARLLVWAAGRLGRRFLGAPRPSNRRPVGGGLVVALVGVDGSGKSTLLAGLTDWLGGKVDVLPVYFGTGDGRPSLFLRPFKWLMPLAAKVLGAKPSVASHGKATAGPPSRAYSLCLAVWAMAVALDKRVKLATVWRGANRGLVVLTDRYPQSEARHFNDGPLLDRLPTAPPWLRRRERSVYERAHKLRPDLVLKLVASPETLAGREPTMDPTAIARRLEALSSLRFGGAEVVSIDVEQPLGHVLRQAKREIWSRL